MVIRELKGALTALIKAHRPGMVWGPPGTGKSDTVREVAHDLSIDLVDLRVSLLDPVDLRGLPYMKSADVSAWAPPVFLPREGSGTLFLDELSAAPPAVQVACYQLVLDRRLGEYVLPEGWTVLAAGNRREDGAVVTSMSTALLSRFVHLTLDVDTDSWLDWALAKGLEMEVVQFIRFRPALLHDFDRKKHDSTFPCPRTWHFLSDLLKVAGPGIHPEMVNGTVGEGAGTEFLAFLDLYKELPSPQQVLLDPNGTPLPKKSGVWYAMSGALQELCGSNSMGQIITYLSRGPAEIMALTMSAVARKSPALLNCREFQVWLQANQDLLKG